MTIVAPNQISMSIRKAPMRSPRSATSTSMATPSGVTIACVLRRRPSRSSETRSGAEAKAVLPAARHEIEQPQHGGDGGEGETPGGYVDQLPEAALDDTGDEQH